MTPEQGWETLAQERRSFADVLDTLTPEQWEAPSLCGEWTVREVVAHLMVGQTGAALAFVGEMAKARFRFDVANQRLAAKRAALPTEQLVADLREHAGHRFRPPSHDWHAPYTDLLVHRLDCLVPLGIASKRPAELWRDSLDFLVSPAGRRGFVARGLPRLTLAASDLDWTSGVGPRVAAPVEVLALAMLKRPARVDELTGPGARTLRAWAGATES